MTDFDRDPEALAWARAKVQEYIDRLADFEQQANATSDSITANACAVARRLTERHFLGDGGGTVGIFEERLPADRLAESGVDTPGCDCGHDGMGISWHPTDCDWRAACTADLHARRAHPGFEYATTEGPRKQWDDVDIPPEGDGWVRNTEEGRNGWERWDYTEESYWRRPRTIPDNPPASTIAVDNCCGCGSPQVVYRNYREQPFCANCACGQQPCVNAAVTNTDICGSYRPPKEPADSGCCARCGMYDWKHAQAQDADNCCTTDARIRRLVSERFGPPLAAAVDAALDEMADGAATSTDAADNPCVCGEPEAPGVLHSAVSPCHIDERDADLEQSRAEAEAWRRKAIRRALRAGRLRTVLDAVHELAAEENTARNEWGSGYREALSDLRQVLRELDPGDSETPAEAGRADRAYWDRRNDTNPQTNQEA